MLLGLLGLASCRAQLNPQLEADLREAGKVVGIVGARLDEKPPLPRLEIQVRDSDVSDVDIAAGERVGHDIAASSRALGDS